MKKNRILKRVAILSACLAVIGSAAWHIVGNGNTATAVRAPITIGMATIEDVVTAQGQLEPKEYVDVGAQVSGQLQKLHVEIGDTVEQGTLIAEIDPELQETKVKADEASIKTLNAQIAQQNAQLTLAKKQYDRYRKLMESRAISAESFETKQSELDIAKAQLQSLQAQLEQAQSTLEGDRTSLGYTKIYAPMSGTVVTQTSREGQTLNAMQAAPVIVQLANLDTMTVRAQVAEADVMKLKSGMPVYFTTLGSDRRWQGKIRQILPSPEEVNDVVLYNVLVDAGNEDRQLMTGMSTQMFFVLGRAENVPAIPVSALGKRMQQQDSAAGNAYEVSVPDGGGTAPRVIHVGLMDRTMAEIRDGLSPGDKVVPAAPVTTAAKTDAKNAGRRGMGPRL